MRENIKSLLKNEKYKGRIIIVGVILLNLIAVIGCNSIFSDETNSEVKKPETISHSNLLAYNFAKDFVKNRLKSPSTAEFPGVYEKDKHSKYIGDDTYKIISWVDSQNSFGATIRTKFICEIKFVNETIQLNYIEFVE